ncbi:hypothetical protein [Chryseobacterium sp.]|uniref:hypothetical protein n=1 Tax=Chryseobacterium sp. TaxID=1871047 RepID=UPI0025B865A7|nr:hypothetical protein [Chryseobacterium sp.]
MSFNSEKSLCLAYVNGVRVFTNYYDKGPLSAGYNISPYLEKGENEISIQTASITALQGNSSFDPDFKCSVKISKRTGLEKPVDLTNLIARVDDQLQPTGHLSSDYRGNSGQGSVQEYKKEGTILYEIKRELNITDIPEWVWTKADHFEITEENKIKLQQAYKELLDLFDSKNIAGIKKKSEISFTEKEKANGLIEGMWYNSLELDQKLEESIGTVIPDWKDYELEVLREGRLVRFNNRGFSPIRLKNKENKSFWGYNPWFSLIDGELVITR